MNQRTWIELELETAQLEFELATHRLGEPNATEDTLELAKFSRNYWSGYSDALTNALNNLEGMTDNEPELPSHYLPSEVRNQTLTPETLERIAQDLRNQGISGLNVGLALDLITN